MIIAPGLWFHYLDGPNMSNPALERPDVEALLAEIRAHYAQGCRPDEPAGVPPPPPAPPLPPAATEPGTAWNLQRALALPRNILRRVPGLRAAIRGITRPPPALTAPAPSATGRAIEARIQALVLKIKSRAAEDAAS